MRPAALAGTVVMGVAAVIVGDGDVRMRLSKLAKSVPTVNRTVLGATFSDAVALMPNSSASSPAATFCTGSVNDGACLAGGVGARG